MLTDKKEAECDLNWFITALPSHQEFFLNPCSFEAVCFFLLSFLLNTLWLYLYYYSFVCIPVKYSLHENMCIGAEQGGREILKSRCHQKNRFKLLEWENRSTGQLPNMEFLFPLGQPLRFAIWTNQSPWRNSRFFNTVKIHPVVSLVLNRQRQIVHYHQVH